MCGIPAIFRVSDLRVDHDLERNSLPRGTPVPVDGDTAPVASSSNTLQLPCISQPGFQSIGDNTTNPGTVDHGELSPDNAFANRSVGPSTLHLPSTARRNSRLCFGTTDPLQQPSRPASPQQDLEIPAIRSPNTARPTPPPRTLRCGPRCPRSPVPPRLRQPPQPPSAPPAYHREPPTTHPV